MNDNQRKSIEFAYGISKLAEAEGCDNTAAFNGLAIATAAFLTDVCTTSSTSVDATALFSAAETYIKNLSQAIEFAKRQIEDGSVEEVLNSEN